MKPAYAASSLDLPLPFPENQELTYMTSPEDTKVCPPPGIQSLRQWGCMRRKHRGKTFLETVDCQYAMCMLRHPQLSSDWAKSFQEFVKAWNLVQKESLQQVTLPQPMAKSKSGKAATIPDWSDNKEEMIMVSPNLKSQGVMGSQKQEGYPDDGQTTTTATEVDQEMVENLKTQIVLLQRQLDQLTKGTVNK